MQSFAKLVPIKEDGHDGTSLILERDQVYVIGRGLSADFKIPDPNVQKVHCSIDYIDGLGVRIIPSKDAVVSVNGKEVDAPALLSDGDLITMGSKTLRIHVDKMLSMDSALPCMDPKPLLVDLISPPRINKVTVRAKTKNKSLISATKPRNVKTVRGLKDSPVKRQLFEQENNQEEVVVKTGRTRRRSAKRVNFQ